MADRQKKKVYRIGCQSWQYDDWVTEAGGETIFYPRGTRAPDMLALYAEIFNTIEVDSTAYGTPALSTIASWLSTTPDDFLFSLKVPRIVTHELSLRPESYRVFDEFVDAAKSFGPKLGIILIQLPAAFEPTRDNGHDTRSFLARLPAGIRFGIEFRHPGWFVEWTFDELNDRQIALALVAGKWIPEETMFAAFGKVQTPFSYLRFMGIRDLPKFDRIYRERSDELTRWAKRIDKMDSDEIFIYVDNYFEGHAPATANRLKELLNVEAADAAALEVQPSLF